MLVAYGTRTSDPKIIRRWSVALPTWPRCTSCKFCFYAQPYIYIYIVLLLLIYCHIYCGGIYRHLEFILIFLIVLMHAINYFNCALINASIRQACDCSGTVSIPLWTATVAGAVFSYTKWRIPATSWSFGVITSSNLHYKEVRCAVRCFLTPRVLCIKKTIALWNAVTA